MVSRQFGARQVTPSRTFDTRDLTGSNPTWLQEPQSERGFHICTLCVSMPLSQKSSPHGCADFTPQQRAPSLNATSDALAYGRLIPCHETLEHAGHTCRRRRRLRSAAAACAARCWCTQCLRHFPRC